MEGKFCKKLYILDVSADNSMTKVDNVIHKIKNCY